ncbi:hypothetical protein C8Q79DRAFT_326235 [Trametes meyenii]|nr:hypothetical protein C8Q79DRAFT_326235 [Trametes meyenii]
MIHNNELQRSPRPTITLRDLDHRGPSQHTFRASKPTPQTAHTSKHPPTEISPHSPFAHPHIRDPDIPPSPVRAG